MAHPHSENQESTQVAPAGEAPTGLRAKLKLIGPGVAIAATGVGAGDMVTALVAGAEYEATFVWAIVVGVVIKLGLVEGMARWYMATGQTIIAGWHAISRWASGYFVSYLFLVMFFYGAAITSASALAVDAMFPGVLSVTGWAIVHGIVGFAVLLVGRYGFFERLMEVFVGIMFLTVVTLGVFLAPQVGTQILAGLLPTLPEGSTLYALGVIGGLSGTYSLAAYSYWVRARGWQHRSWIPMMRLDSGVGFIITGLFMVSMLIVGAAFLYGTGTSISDEEGLVTVAGPMAEQYGQVVKWLFLVGFWSAATSSIFGGWNAAAYLFADYVRNARRAPDDQIDAYVSEKSLYFRGFLVWCAFPPMLLLLFGEPVLLVVIYAALGALLLPFMAATLLYLLNSGKIPSSYRNNIATNVLLVVALLVFAAIAVDEIRGLL
ncbi:MAG: Nramp family divalent metal transporter [Actinomycetota bacterium]|nr:Nramp family divalent metal transporter [Actinomycetota bacterium]